MSPAPHGACGPRRPHRSNYGGATLDGPHRAAHSRCVIGTRLVEAHTPAVLVRQLISDVHWLARTEQVSLRATPQFGYELILVCAAAAKRSFEASFFDYVRVQDGLIIERVQQADVLGPDAPALRQSAGPGRP
jgi:hypothetical protein